MNHLHESILPEFGGTQRLTKLIGLGLTLEIILLGNEIDAEKAIQMGLVAKAVPDGEVEGEAIRLAQKMAKNAQVSLRFIKEAVRDGTEINLTQGLRLEADLYFLMHTTKDRSEGISAFRERRKQKYSGK
jgi:enoyl-CoA hydratase/carnithine racemase